MDRRVARHSATHMPDSVDELVPAAEEVVAAQGGKIAATFLGDAAIPIWVRAWRHRWPLRIGIAASNSRRSVVALSRARARPPERSRTRGPAGALTSHPPACGEAAAESVSRSGPSKCIAFYGEPESKGLTGLERTADARCPLAPDSEVPSRRGYHLTRRSSRRTDGRQRSDGEAPLRSAIGKVCPRRIRHPLRGRPAVHPDGCSSSRFRSRSMPSRMKDEVFLYFVYGTSCLIQSHVA
jgi:hypothetical protein